MEVTLRRDSTSDKGTFGALIMNDEQLCLTCERPKTGDIVCIPPGIYPVIPHDSPAHPHTWEITNVPGRTAILIHNGNEELQSKGCVLVGDSLGIVNDLPAVLNSVSTLNMLRSKLPSNFTLTVTEEYDAD